MPKNRRRALGAIAAVVLCLGAAAPAHAADAVQPPSRLTVEQQAQPLAVENLDSPPLGWALGDNRDGAQQTAYEIRVGTAPGATDTWASGKVESSASANVPYAGPALKSSQRYWWSVRTWDAAGQAGPWSAPANFGTAVKSDWAGTPIWAPGRDTTGWTDYGVDVDFTVTAVAAGVFFRGSSTSNAYMWQVRASNAPSSPNALVLHYVANGTYTAFKTVPLPAGVTIAPNTQHHLTIQATGSTITTSIDGTPVDSTVNTRFASGAVGFRHGSTETATYDNLVVKNTAGSTLYANDFSQASADFPCGTVGSGVLSVGRSGVCLVNAGDEWAFMRKSFSVADKEIAWATAYLTARSTEPARQYVYRASLNGSFVGVGPTRAKNSGSTMYNAYDIKSLLRRGEANAFGALAYTTTDKRFLAQIVIAYADGTRDVIASDGSWKTLQGQVAMPAAGSIGTSYFAAPVENIDARRYPSGYDTPGFDDSGWVAPAVKDVFTGRFGQPVPPVKQELVKPAKIVAGTNGRYLLDFGHTVVGGLQLKLNGAGGEPVEIRLGEELTSGAVLTPASTVRYQLRATNTYRDVWTLRPGAQTLSLWGYRVFRYAEVIGSPEALTEDNVAAAALVYPYDAGASSFSSSSAPLDEVYGFSRTGVRALNFDLHLDSPTRERAPYEGDNLIHMLIEGYDDGDWANSKYSLEWLIENATWPAEWRFSSILSTWEYWKATGDLSSARTYYDNLKAFLPTQYLRSDGLVEKPPGSSSQPNADLVDWPDAERDGYVFTTVNTVINSWSYRAFADMADLAAALGNDADAAQWTATATKLRAAINEKLYDPATGNYKDGLTTTHKAVHASVFPVAFGVAGPEQLGPATQYIANRGMVCSVFCANFLINALYKAGRATDAVNLLTGTGTRSWRHMIALGAGSPMEAWDPSLKSNTTFSHPWAGSPAYLVYRGALGIEALEPGYTRFAVRPQAGGLTHAEGVTPTVRGDISAAFATGDAGVMDLALRVPAGTTARVTLPSAGPDTVYVDRVAKTGTVGTDGVTLDVAAGCHILSTRAATGTPETVLSAVRACDTTAPALTVPADMDLTSSGPNGTPVTFAATASDVIDEDVPVSCTQASGSTFTVGTTTVTCTATDGAGNTTSRSFTVRVTQVVPVEGGVGGTVPATLSLTLGAPASFGAFTPGVTKDYTAATTANVISTAGDALLSVSDPGHLTNGAFSLPQPLVVELSKSTWTAPVSNDPVAITFKQHIDATDALRTGSYSKTLTFTLSTTAP